MSRNKSIPGESCVYDRQQHLQEVARLLRAGFSQREVARQLKVSDPQITYDIQRIRKQQAEDKLLDRAEAINEKVAQLRDIRRLATIEYMRSIRGKHKKVTEMEPEEDCHACSASGVRVNDKGESSTCKTCKGRMRVGGIIKVIETKEGQCGDPAYLNVIRACLADERELLGLDAAKKTENKSEVQVFDWSAILDALPPGPQQDVVEAELQRKLESTTQAQGSAGYMVEPVKLQNGLKELPLSKRAQTNGDGH